MFSPRIRRYLRLQQILTALTSLLFGILISVLSNWLSEQWTVLLPWVAGAFMLALRQVSKARKGVSTVARHAGLNRASLTRALSAKGNPELSSLNRILRATGLRLLIASGVPVRKSKAAAEPVRK